MNKYNVLLEKAKVDVLWISNEYNKRYITGFTGTTSEVFITKDQIYILTDGRYKTQVAEQVKEGVEILITETPKSYLENTKDFLKGYKIVGVESEHVSYAMFNKLSEQISAEVVGVVGAIEELRAIKDDTEMTLIKKACQISDDCYKYVYENIKPGMTEIEIQVMIESYHILNGGESICHTIVATGENAAKPHAVPTTRKVVEGDIITLDIGVFYEGYCSDMTRTFFLGEAKDEELKKIHGIVLEANRLQTEAVKAGVVCKDIDAIGRDYITSQGYGDKFIHGTGHGMGLEVHEEPYVAIGVETILEAGNVITIEPGIYIEGLGGVRIENDILVKEDGHEILNKSPMGYKF